MFSKQIVIKDRKRHTAACDDDCTLKAAMPTECAATLYDIIFSVKTQR